MSLERRVEAPAAADGDGGYALLAAVAALAAFAYIAFQVLAASQGGVALEAARMDQAKLAAAADAGLALAIHGLAARNQGARWSIDGRERTLEFEGTSLTITVQDERGKVPLSGLSDDQARALFAGAGARAGRLDALAAEYHAWQSEETSAPDPDAIGAAAPPDGLVRHGPFRTVGELAALRDMDPATFARIAPVATVFFENDGPFEPDHAQPLAKSAMDADALASPDQLDAEAAVANQRPVEELADDQSLIGRPLTISVVARRGDARTHRMEIVEFTGDKVQPVWIRYVE